MSKQPRRAWTAWATLERVVLGALCIATATGALLAAKNGLVPVQRPLTHGLILWKWFVLFDVVLALPVGLVLWGTTRFAPTARATRPLLAALAAGLVLLLLGGNARAVAQLPGLVGPAQYRLLLPAAFAMSIMGLVLAGFSPARLRWPPRLAALLSVAACVAALAPWSQGAASAMADAGRLPSLRLRGERLLLFGLDGADWKLMEPLLQRGELPHMARLREAGVWGSLATLAPTKSPAIWTTIATGQPPGVHRIRDFTERRLRGADDALGRLRPVHRVGFDVVQEWLRSNGEIVDSPVSSVSRRVPALWELTSGAGTPLDVVNWWATWPAEPILGRVVSQRVYFWRFAARGWNAETERVTYPPTLYREIEHLVMAPDDVEYTHARSFMEVSPEEFEQLNSAPFRKHAIGSEFKYFISMFETTRRLALHLMESSRERYSQPSDMLLMVRLVDMACHTSLRESELVDDHLEASDQDLRRYSGVVSEAYRAADRFLGELIDAFGAGNVIVVSDHGFGLQYHWPKWTRSYDHTSAQPGVFLAAGRAFGAGKVEGLSVYDILPLLAYLKDLPLADDLPGRLPTEVLDRGLIESRPAVHVASYGGRGPVGRQASGRSAVDEVMVERLRALGYVN